MSYIKQNFVKGQVLKADHLNHMEDGIAELEEKILAGGGGGSTASPSVATLSPAQFGAAGDGETDDTDALNAAFNRNNVVIDGGNKLYKYLVINIVGAENLEIRNVVFWKGQQVNLKGCKNVRFVHCRWEGINCNEQDISTYGVELTNRVKGDGTTRCEEITFEGCIFRDIWYNEQFSIENDRAHYNTGQGIRPAAVHKFFVRHCLFTQIKGNAAIHWNSYEPGSGYFEITDNLFYLTGWGGVCMFATQSEFDRMVGKVSNNHFIGCGLGYIPDSYMDTLDPSIRGVGCAAMLGGYLSQYTPYKPHAICENNVYEDNVESSIEGPAWNPIIGNYITGQGALQDEANCAALKEKYHLDYNLKVRYNPSVNFIYRGQENNADGATVFEEYDPMVITSNVMGKPYVDLDGFMMFTGDFGSPVIITNNVLDIEDKKTGHVYSHFLSCHFHRGLTIEGNSGIKPYLNQCTIEGDLVLDELLGQWETDFSKCNLVVNRGKERFPETMVTSYDPAKVLLDNDQATAKKNIVTLAAYDVPERAVVPTDTVYDIRSASGYTEATGYVFPGPDSPTHIDTGIQILKDNANFTIYLEFEGNSITNITSEGSGIMSLFKVYDKATDSSRMSVGGLWQNFNTAMNETSSVWYSKDLDAANAYTLKNLKMLVRRKGDTLEFWLTFRDSTATSLTTHKVMTYEITDEVNWKDFGGNLYIGSEDNYKGSNDYALWGKMYEFRVFNRAVSDTEAGALLYNALLASGGDSTVEPTVVYDISSDSHYDATKKCVSFDGTFGIDTGVELFADDSDFTALVQFDIDDYKEAGLTNFNFIPVLSSMNYTADADHATNQNSPGFDLGLSLQDGEKMDTVATGGFVGVRNSWKFSNCVSIDPSNYFDYYSRKYGIIFIRKDGVLNIYDYNMQNLLTIIGADATTKFNGTLHIGENMVAPTLAGNNKLKGRVYECKVYHEALTTSYLESQYPNIYSNDKRTKGTARYIVQNPFDNVQLVRKMCLDVAVDMGEFNSPKYTGVCPKAIGVKVENVPDVYWIGTGTNGRLRLWLDGKQEIQPYGRVMIDVVNTGLCSGLEATVKALHCTMLTEIQDYSAATDMSIEWDGDTSAIAIGQTLTGRVSWIPDGANAETILWVQTNNDNVAVNYSNGIFTAQGKAAGTTTMTCVMLNGTKKTCTFTVI